MKKFLALAALSAVSAVPSYAQSIATWTFETTSNSITGTSATIGPIAADSGTGNATGVHASSATVWSHPAGNGSPSSFSVNTWAVGDYFQFQFSTTGFHGLSLSWDQTSSNTGPGHYTLSYSLDNGANFTTVGSYSVLPNASPNAWNINTANSLFTLSYDLGSAIDDSSSVLVRLTDADTVSANGGTVATTGTDRIDNFNVFTTPVPEPSAAALGILGGLSGLLIWKRRK